MRQLRTSDRVRRVAIVVSAAIAADLMLWRLWPSGPLPPVSLPGADRASEEAPPTDTEPES
jgi:hypothetical protein